MFEDEDDAREKKGVDKEISSRRKYKTGLIKSTVTRSPALQGQVCTERRGRELGGLKVTKENAGLTIEENVTLG